MLINLLHASIYRVNCAIQTQFITKHVTGSSELRTHPQIPSDWKSVCSQNQTLSATHLDFNHGCQMAIARYLDRMRLALPASGLWLRYAALQNLIPSFPWIAPPRPPPWHNPRKGRDQILPSGNHNPYPSLLPQWKGRIERVSLLNAASAAAAVVAATKE